MKKNRMAVLVAWDLICGSFRVGVESSTVESGVLASASARGAVGSKSVYFWQRNLTPSKKPIT